MATRLWDFWRTDGAVERAERAELKSLMAQLEESERARRAVLDRIVAMAKRESVKSAELKRQLPDLFD
ncbi:hypothetical protein [uncultured Sphingomonas sp.]|uniref:hypothetical protein n=1 Tax=uncultured Sphingomonas sp. TaxID=158754 RepID=UPI0035CC4637